MAGKKMEGDAAQRRAKAREARERGRPASAEGATTGGSKQRRHLGRHDDQVDKQQAPRQSKQRAPSVDPDAQKRPRTRRWHRDHEHDEPGEGPRDYETRGEDALP